MKKWKITMHIGLTNKLYAYIYTKSQKYFSTISRALGTLDLRVIWGARIFL